MSHTIATITLDASKHDSIGTFYGAEAQPYAYKDDLRAFLDGLCESARRSTNRHYVVDGTTVRAAQSTHKGAMAYMRDGYVLVSIKGCGRATHVDGTNGGMMPCGANLTRFGNMAPYYCALCDPFVAAGVR